MSLQLFYNLNKTVLYDWAEVQLKFKTNLKKKVFMSIWVHQEIET